MPARKPPATSSQPTAKRSLKDALDAALDLDALEKIVKEALSAEREVAIDVEVECKGCHKRQRPRVKVLVPDWNARKGFLQLAIEHSQGRAGVAPAPKKAPSVSAGSFGEMSDEDLLALINLEVESGEVVGEPAEEAA